MAKDAKTKALAKIMHGQGKPGRDIARACNITLTIAQQWVHAWEKDGYPKGYLQSKLDQAQEKAAIKVAEKQGLTEARVKAKVAALMDAKKTVFWQGVPMAEVEDNGTQVAAASLGADILNMKRQPSVEGLAESIMAWVRSA